MGHAVFVVHQHEVHGVMGFLQRHGNHHTLASSQTIGLDDDGGTQTIHIGVGCHGVGKGFVLRGRNVVARHEVLGEGLGRLQLRSHLGRAKDLHAVGAEFIDHTCGQRSLRPHHGYGDFFCLRPFAQGFDIGNVDVFQLATGQSCATVTRSHIDFGRLGRLSQLPRHGVFTATAANHKNFHSSALW